MTIVAQDLQVCLARVAEAELARRKLGDFIALLEPSYDRTRHTRVLCDHLEAIESGDLDRLIVQMPPRHGKTLHVSQAFPAWVLGRHPRWQIILASYGSELAEENSRKARSYMRDDAWPFECRVSEESRAANRWHTDKGGILIAAGCEGGIGGRGAHALIIDDPIRDRAEAESEAMRKLRWDWYCDVARTRLMPSETSSQRWSGGRIILCQTRWHDDDLAGRILNSKDGQRWTVLSLPAIAEQDDRVLQRQPGEALWPERYPVESLPSVERGEISSYSFAALYQQTPAPRDGSYFKSEFLSHRFDQLPASIHVQETADDIARRHLFGDVKKAAPPIFIAQAIDGAFKDGVANDFSVIATGCTDTVNYFITDIFRDRMAFPQLKRATVEQFDLFQPRAIWIEDTASGIPLIQTLKVETALPIIGVPALGSKESRVEATLGLWESGRVLLRRNAPWLDQLIDEFMRFNVGRHDDVVDAVTLLLIKLHEFVRLHRARRQQPQNIFRWKER
jgi:predicted phage terminase large subunit-like protein